MTRLLIFRRLCRKYPSRFRVASRRDLWKLAGRLPS